MKKKKYEKPSLEVVVLKQLPTLLAGSQGQAGVQNYNWSTETEE